ncbi:hypothetical protein JRI60_28730 [Archangium violaceum]|uniref:hypothetical protein n=1 Tax=Archangium violaceum TaxID=83451 RepID=UPI001951534B|nr:hypothetical protein [Archangium violaceum]QRN93187.1 hypothetical protein JRI60_28730 [Archangium violaceum]
MPKKPNPYVARNYTHLQLITWEHFTSELTKPGDEPELNPTRPNEKDPNKPIPIFTNNMRLDERTRLKRLLGVVELARQKLANTDDSKTLKIFLAPEFTFRPDKNDTDEAQEKGIGPGATYTRDAMTQILTTLREMFSDEKYRDWLFVPGTIFWSEPVKIGLVNDYVFFNTALMFKGGATNAPFTCIHKHAAALSDKADPQKSAEKNPLFKDILGKKEDRKFNVLDTDDIRFGLEICLDHGARILKDAVMRDYYVNEQNEHPFVDVHLLVACDKAVEPRNLAITEGGYFMRVDGSPSVAGVSKQPTPGYGLIPGKSSSIFRGVTQDEMPKEYAKDSQKLVDMIPEDEDNPVYISHYDANGQSMLEPLWKENLKDHGALETWAIGTQSLVAYKRQPFQPSKKVGRKGP